MQQRVRLSVFITVMAVLLGGAVAVQAQTWSPTKVVCYQGPLYGGSVSNPDGPLTPTGGDAGLDTWDAGGRKHNEASCFWSGFPNIVTTTETRVTMYVDAYVNANGVANFQIGCTSSCSGSGVYWAPYNGTFSYTVPAGTNLSDIIVNATCEPVSGQNDRAHVTIGYISATPEQ